MAYFGKSSSEGALQKVEPKTIFLVLWVALCGVVLSLIVRGGFGGQQDDTPAVAEHVAAIDNSIAPVLVPQVRIAAGQKLSADMFTIENRQLEGIQNAVVSNIGEIEGAYAAAPIQEKAPLMKKSITFVAPPNAVTSKIPEGYRAVTISVNAETGVEGWVRPGARVDIVWISTIRSKQVVSTIVEDAEILSAENSTDAAAKGAMPSHVTLLTTVEDAQRIQLAKSSGTLSLNLRGTGDRTQKGNNTITLDGLLAKDGSTRDINNVGWVQVGDKAYDVSSSGAFAPSNEKRKAPPLFANEKR